MVLERHASPDSGDGLNVGLETTPSSVAPAAMDSALLHHTFANISTVHVTMTRPHGCMLPWRRDNLAGPHLARLLQRRLRLGTLGAG